VTTSVAVLGPGGVGGFLAATGDPVTVVAREDTAGRIARDGLKVESVRLGAFVVHPPAVATLEAPVDVLVVAVKAPALDAALERIAVQPGLVVPLLNGIEHVERLRRRFGAERVVGATIRIAAERPEPGRVVQTSPLFRVEAAGEGRRDVEAFAHVLRAAEVPTSVHADEQAVLWSKLARLTALALTTAAAGAPIGGVRTHPRWRLLLEDAVDETAQVAAAEGAPVDPHAVLAELAELQAEHTSSLARDVDAGRPDELDAIGGAVLRAAARHGVGCPAIEQLVEAVRARYAAR
jgi:2-dehydropantoate 2-reductase